MKIPASGDEGRRYAETAEVQKRNGVQQILCMSAICCIASGWRGLRGAASTMRQIDTCLTKGHERCITVLCATSEQEFRVKDVENTCSTPPYAPEAMLVTSRQDSQHPQCGYIDLPRHEFSLSGSPLRSCCFCEGDLRELMRYRRPEGIHVDGKAIKTVPQMPRLVGNNGPGEAHRVHVTAEQLGTYSSLRYVSGGLGTTEKLCSSIFAATHHRRILSGDGFGPSGCQRRRRAEASTALHDGAERHCCSKERAEEEGSRQGRRQRSNEEKLKRKRKGAGGTVERPTTKRSPAGLSRASHTPRRRVRPPRGCSVVVKALGSMGSLENHVETIIEGYLLARPKRASRVSPCCFVNGGAATAACGAVVIIDVRSHP